MACLDTSPFLKEASRLCLLHSFSLSLLPFPPPVVEIFSLHSTQYPLLFSLFHAHHIYPKKFKQSMTRQNVKQFPHKFSLSWHVNYILYQLIFYHNVNPVHIQCFNSNGQATPSESERQSENDVLFRFLLKWLQNPIEMWFRLTSLLLSRWFSLSVETIRTR